LNLFLQLVDATSVLAHVHRHSVTGISLPPVDANLLLSFEHFFFHWLGQFANWPSKKNILLFDYIAFVDLRVSC